jgi:uncharacterized protein (TIGR02147 family)
MLSPSLSQFDDYRAFLSAVFASRQKKNPKYSLRSFARDLDLAPSSLSELLKKRYQLSIKKSGPLCTRLNLSNLERQLFVEIVRLNRATKTIQLKEILSRICHLKMEIAAFQLREEWLLIIREWYHIAIVELTRIDEFKNDDRWIARRLGIKPLQVKPAISRLIKVGMLKEEDGRLAAAAEFTTTSQGIPSETIQYLHRQILSLAQRSIQSHPIEIRDNSFVMFATSKDQLENCRASLQNFRRDLMQKLENVPTKDAVYCLAMSLFPLDQN